ncbi:MAG: SpoIIE family protein phosphatase [Leptospirales bacterium]|jgi:serine phosphatase RsbU (regulator of sigma subunit)
MSARDNERGTFAPESGVPVEAPRILVVDDNEDMLVLISSLLGKKGYAIITAQNGRDGLDKARKLRPDLILMDVLMPEMNGYDATHKIKSDPFLAAIPVVLLTARSDTEDKLEGLEQGADDYISKPFDRRELIARVDSLLRISRYRRLLAQRNQQIESELDMARALQQKLLPDRTPEIEGMRIHARYIPMDKIGGDFYDFVVTGSGQDKILGVLLADVTGHGIPGAFFSAVAKMAFHYNQNLRETGPALLERINEAVLQYSVMGMFLTGLYVCFYPAQRRLKYTLAGQCRPLLHRRATGEMIELMGRGFPIGIREQLDIEEKQVELQSGDRLLIYTDGLTEVNDDLELFGDDGLKEFMLSHGELNASDLVDALLDHLRLLGERDDFTDDLTALVFDID